MHSNTVQLTAGTSTSPRYEDVVTPLGVVRLHHKLAHRAGPPPPPAICGVSLSVYAACACGVVLHTVCFGYGHWPVRVICARNHVAPLNEAAQLHLAAMLVGRIVCLSDAAQTHLPVRFRDIDCPAAGIADLAIAVDYRCECGAIRTDVTFAQKDLAVSLTCPCGFKKDMTVQEELHLALLLVQQIEDLSPRVQQQALVR